MLRGRTEAPLSNGAAIPPPSVPPGSIGFPGVDEPYDMAERPAGVIFYQGRVSFFLPYHLLQAMQFGEERLTMLFAADEIRITGRGLHELYVRLAAHQICRIVEQGDRYAAISEAALFVIRIERIRRTENQTQKREK